MTISLALGPSTILVLVVLVTFIILYFAAWLPIERGRRPALRPLRPLNRLQGMIEQSAESGQSVHYSPGNGGLNSQPGTAESLNGLTALSSVARRTARARSGLTVSTNDTLTYLAADDTVKAEYVLAGRREDYRATDVRYISQQDRLGYIAGVDTIIGQKEVSGSILLGQFGSEYLLAGDRANRQNVSQVVGSSRVEALPVMLASAGPENTLLGEEIFAAPAYLDRRPSHLASLVAQDRLRLVVVGLIVLGVLLSSLGLVPNIGNFFLR